MNKGAYHAVQRATSEHYLLTGMLFDMVAEEQAAKLGARSLPIRSRNMVLEQPARLHQAVSDNQAYYTRPDIETTKERLIGDEATIG